MENRVKKVEETLETLAVDIEDHRKASRDHYRNILAAQAKNTEAIEALAARTGSLVDAWEKGNVVAGFMKWMSGIAIMAATLYQIITGKPWS